MKSKLPFRISLILLVILVCYEVINVPIGFSPHAHINANDLLFDIDTDLPALKTTLQEAQIRPPYPEADKFGIEQLGVILISIDGQNNPGMAHTVIRARNTFRAARAYDYMLWSKTVNTWDGFPVWWSYKSNLADEWTGGCSSTDKLISCIVIARYSEFISVVDVTFLAGPTAKDQIQQIVKSVDQRFAKQFE